MKMIPTLILVGLAAVASSAWLGHRAGYQAGYRASKNELPSCLYLDRPRQNDVKPWGCDNKEGIDWHYDKISGGGLYVDLSKWKDARQPNDGTQRPGQ